MKLVFIGPQGSGKGTQAKIISERLNISHISAGDLLREATGELKIEVDSFMNKGELISDELMIKIIKERLNSEDCKNGFILDGFPRNLGQAEMLEEITKIDKIIEISISDTEAVKRISGRRSCLECGKIYNIHTNPKPKKENLCDECDLELTQRADDNEEAVKKRLEIYHSQTEPILEKYPSIKINGEQEIEIVAEDILKEIK